MEQPYEKPGAEETPKPDDKKKPVKTAAKPAPGAKAPKEAPMLVEEGKVFERQPLSFRVTGKNDSLLKLVEALGNTSPEKMSPHFFIIRTLRVENEKKDGPPKNQVVTSEEVTAIPNDKNSVFLRDAMYLLGNEQVRMHLELDLVRFVAEPAAPEKAGTAKPTAAAASATTPAP